MPTINLHLGDSLEAMRQMPDKVYDLAIVDPPYGINISHNIGRRSVRPKSKLKPAGWDSAPPPPEYFHELFRVSKNQIVWGANHFISLMPYDSSCWLLWDKLFSDEVSFSQFELAWTSFSQSAKKFECARKQETRIHPTQKPVALYKWLLGKYASPGYTILDTHGGSMSIAIACHDMGFDLDLWELDPDYHAAGVKRYQQHIQQGQLFTPMPALASADTNVQPQLFT